MRRLVLSVIAGVVLVGAAMAADAPEKKVPTPQELWAMYEPQLPPLQFTIKKDQTITSAVAPRIPMRRIEVSFVSQKVFGKDLRHNAVIYVPSTWDSSRYGKVVIVGSIAGDFQNTFEYDYGQPMAAQNNVPVMILPNPGETEDAPGREWRIQPFLETSSRTRCATDHYFFRLAVPYVRAMDVFADVLKIPRDDIRALIGGHSKRAPTAYMAAAIRPRNVAGVVFMGMEGAWTGKTGGAFESVGALWLEQFVQCPTIYLGATNEDGYSMFNVTRNQSLLKKPWTVSMVPNYRHAAESPQQFLIWRMWAAHCLDGRPVARVWDATHEESPEGIRFRAHIEDKNTIVQVRAWYAYCDDVPLWRDVVWYPVVMRPKEGDLWEGYERGKTPDAWMVEVEDVGGGFHGYVTSCPQNITGKEVRERTSRGSRSKLWEEK